MHRAATLAQVSLAVITRWYTTRDWRGTLAAEVAASWCREEEVGGVGVFVHPGILALAGLRVSDKHQLRVNRRVRLKPRNVKWHGKPLPVVRKPRDLAVLLLVCFPPVFKRLAAASRGVR